VAYLRTSTGEQTLGPAAQREQIAAWAACREVKIAAWHEEHVSGGAPLERRPALLGALAELGEHGAGVLVAARRCRLARSVVAAVQIESLARLQGAEVHTADGVPPGDEPEAKLFRVLVDAIAEFHLVLGRLRTRQALQVLRRRDSRISGHPPIGWRHDEAGRLLPVEAEQRAIRRVTELRGEGVTIAEIVRTLNAERQACRGQRWHRSAVSRILRRSVPDDLQKRPNWR
jgi:DNA invertase Pin-like site-specific DNA recombinase